MFAEAEGPSGCITYQALKQALVRSWLHVFSTVWYNCGATQHMQVRNGGVQVLDVEALLAEVVTIPHDKIDYHDMVSSFYFDSLPKQ